MGRVLVILLVLIGAVFSAPSGYTYKLIGYSPTNIAFDKRGKVLEEMRTDSESLQKCPSDFDPTKAESRPMTRLRVMYKGKEVDALGVSYMNYKTGLGYMCIYRVDYPELDTKEAQVIEDLRSRYSFKALLESGKMPSLPEFLTDIIFGKVGEKKISSFSIAREHPTFAFLVNFRQGFGELFDKIKTWIMFLSLAGFMSFLLYGIVHEKVRTGQVDVVLYLRRNLVYLGALLFFTFPLIGHDTVAWKAIEFSTSIAHFLGNKIAEVFVDAYMDTKIALAKRNIFETLKVGNQDVTTLLVSAKGTASMMKDYCCSFFGDEQKKERKLCEQYLGSAGDNVVYALQRMDTSLEKALKVKKPEQAWPIFRKGMEDALDYLEEAKVQLSHYRENLKSTMQASNGCIGAMWTGTYDREKAAEDSDWASLYDRLSSKVNLAQESIKNSQELQEMITDYVRNFKGIKDYTKDYIEAAGWVAVPTVYFATIAPFLSYESEKGEELSYQKQVEKKKELEPSTIENILSNLPILGLPPMYQLFSAGMNIVNSIAKQAVSGGLMKGVVGKLLGVAGGASPWLVLLLGGLAYLGAVAAVAYISIVLGFFLLEILAQAAILIAFWLKVASFLKEIIKYYYTTPFFVFWAMTGRGDDKFGSWIAKLGFLTFYPSILVIGVVIAMYAFEMVNILTDMVSAMILGARVDTGGMGMLASAEAHITGFFKAIMFAGLVKWIGAVTKIIIAWTLINNLTDWFSEQLQTRIQPTAEGISRDVVGRVRDKLTI